MGIDDIALGGLTDLEACPSPNAHLGGWQLRDYLNSDLFGGSSPRDKCQQSPGCMLREGESGGCDEVLLGLLEKKEVLESDGKVYPISFKTTGQHGSQNCRNSWVQPLEKVKNYRGRR